MLQGTENFSIAIKERCREVNMKITCTTDDTVYVIEGNEIIEVNYTSQAEKSLGSVVSKVLDAKLRTTSNTMLLKHGSVMQITYICDGDCECDVLFVDYTKEKNNVITVQAFDLLNYLNSQNNSSLPVMIDTDLKTYMKSCFDSLGAKSYIKDIVNTNLKIAYPKSSDIIKSFKEMATAANALIHFGQTGQYSAKLPLHLPQLLNKKVVGVEVKKYCFSELCETIDSYINYSVADTSIKYNDIKVVLYSPTRSEQRKIGTMSALIPQNVNNYIPGTVNFEQTFIPSIIKVNDIVEIESIKIGNSTCELFFNNALPIAQEIEAEFYGSSITNTSMLEANTENQNGIKVINNIYIQGSAVYDTRIYKGKDIEINYFGNPRIEVGDTIKIDDLKILVNEHTLKYTGGLKGIIKGVIEC